jgi:Mn-dependent DtxR family transcriptional regulator
MGQWSVPCPAWEFILAMVKDAEESSFGEIRNRLGVTRGYASKYRERLIEAGIVYSTSYGYLAFSPPYMKEYLEEKQGG